MNVLERIKEYLIYKGISNFKFEQSVGYSNGAFASQLKKSGTIGVDKLENILKLYSDLNPNWVLLGEGSMLKENDTVSKVSETTESYKKETVTPRIYLKEQQLLNTKLDIIISQNEIIIESLERHREFAETRPRKKK